MTDVQDGTWVKIITTQNIFINHIKTLGTPSIISNEQKPETEDIFL